MPIDATKFPDIKADLIREIVQRSYVILRKGQSKAKTIEDISAIVREVLDREN